MTDPIQQQLMAARKNQIIEAAAVVFAERGYRTATIRDVAKQAGIADGTIYNYFENKQALLLAIFERMRAHIVEHTPPPVASATLRDTLSAMIAQSFQAMQPGNFALLRIIIAEMMADEALRSLYQQHILQPTVEAGLAFLGHHPALAGHDPARLALVMRATSAITLGLMLESIINPSDQPAALPGLMADMLADALTKKDST